MVNRRSWSWLWLGMLALPWPCKEGRSFLWEKSLGNPLKSFWLWSKIARGTNAFDTVTGTWTFSGLWRPGKWIWREAKGWLPLKMSCCWKGGINRLQWALGVILNNWQSTQSSYQGAFSLFTHQKEVNTLNKCIWRVMYIKMINGYNLIWCKYRSSRMRWFCLLCLWVQTAVEGAVPIPSCFFYWALLSISQSLLPLRPRQAPKIKGGFSSRTCVLILTSFPRAVWCIPDIKLGKEKIPRSLTEKRRHH